METRVSIAGGSGRVGGELTRRLRRAGVPVRVLTRDPAAARSRLADPGVELAAVDFADPATLRAAFAGSAAAFLATGTHERQVADEIALADAAVAAGVPHLVTLSVRGSGLGEDSTVLRWHGQIDAHLAGLPVAATVLRPATYVDMMLRVAATLAAGAGWGGLAGAGAISAIDSRDVAAVAAVVLRDGAGRHGGRAYDLTGPAAVTMPELSGLLGVALHRPVPYAVRTEAEQRAVLAAAGFVPLMVDVLVEIDRLIGSGVSAGTTPTVRELTGRPPYPAADSVAGHLGFFAAARSA
ncbi:MAG TPA: NmrA family NAD(P)-binding protein [Mycobacteriales bacterium]|nr:NmrA family NAD(P)-binding protein [Mycobacteriales bacterium]